MARGNNTRRVQAYCGGGSASRRSFFGEVVGPDLRQLQYVRQRIITGWPFAWSTASTMPFSRLQESEADALLATRGKHSTGARVSNYAYCLVNWKDNFKRFGLLKQQAAFLPGCFKDILPETLARLEAWNRPIHRIRGRIEKIFGTWK
jgi:hypothetical protein